MAEKVRFEDIPHYKAQFENIISDLKVKVDELGKTLKRNPDSDYDENYTPDSMLFSPIGDRKYTYDLPRVSTDVKPKRSNTQSGGSYSLYTSKQQPQGELSERDAITITEANPPRRSQGTASKHESRLLFSDDYGKSAEMSERELIYSNRPTSVRKNTEGIQSKRAASQPREPSSYQERDRVSSNTNKPVPLRLSSHTADYTSSNTSNPPLVSSNRATSNPIYNLANCPQPYATSTPIFQLNSTSTESVPHKHVTFKTSRKEKEPDKFDGKNVDWRDYIVHFEQTASWNGWDDDEKAQQLCMSLRGPAQKLLGDARPEELEDYLALKNMLTRRYAPKERTTAYRVEFNSRMRNRNESLPDYGYALRRLVRLAYPGHEQTEDLAIDQFIKGLENFEMQKRVQFSHPTSLETAIAVAIEYEAFVGSTSKDVRKPKEEPKEYAVQAIKQTDQANAKNKGEAELANLTQTLMNCFQDLNKKIDDFSKSIPDKCTKCSRFGHSQDKCNTPYCSHCKKFGHWTKNHRDNYQSNRQNRYQNQDLNNQGLNQGPETQPPVQK